MYQAHRHQQQQHQQQQQQQQLQQQQVLLIQQQFRRHLQQQQLQKQQREQEARSRKCVSEYFEETRVRVVPDYHEDVKCLICLNIAKEPFCCCYCSALFCEGCIQMWLGKSSVCPQCKGVYDQFNRAALNLFARKLIGKIQISCAYEENGCTQLLYCLPREVDEHEGACGYQLVQCPISACGTTVLKRDLSLHETVCEYKQIPCSFCYATKKRSVERKNLERHLNECEYRPVRCRTCNNEMPYVDLSSHQKWCEIKQGMSNVKNKIFGFFGGGSSTNSGGGGGHSSANQKKKKKDDTNADIIVTCKECQSQMRLSATEKHVCTAGNK